jgi:hypothetical protein
VKKSTPPAASLRAEFGQAPDGTTLVVLLGTIDENADLASVFARLDRDTTMNLEHIERVNSMGVHRWVPLITSFTANHLLMIERISYPLVQNANVVSNLFGAATVRSCIAPYYCPECKTNVSLVIRQQEVIGNGFAPPSKLCAKCNADLEFDELDGYFHFFRNRKRELLLA